MLLLGSDHDRADVYAAVDELGATVVAETHGFGEALLAGRVDEDGDPLDALVRHYRPRPRVAPAAADVRSHGSVAATSRARGRCRPSNVGWGRRS